MGSIISRPRADGTIAYLAKIAIMREGVVMLRESRTFDRKPAAKAWIDNREKELAKPGALDRAKADQNDPPLSVAIDRYIDESEKAIGKTKAQVLRTIKNSPLGAKKCSAVDAEALCDLHQGAGHRALDAGQLPVAPRLDLHHRPADVEIPARQAGHGRRPGGAPQDGDHRQERRARPAPDLAELDKLMEHFGVIAKRRGGSIPMQKIIPFAIFSTRRQDEISRIAWKDKEPGRVMVRDMKHPGEKAGNDTWCDLVPEAERIIERCRRPARRSSRPQPTPSQRPLRGPARCSGSRICTSTTSGTKASPGCSRWAGTSRTSRPCPGIGRGSRLSATPTSPGRRQIRKLEMENGRACMTDLKKGVVQ
jgi:hypothetical protein